MDGNVLAALVAMGTEAVVGVVWAVRQEGRINKVVADVAALDENLDHDIRSVKELFGSKLDDIKERLMRIEKHVLNGSYKDIYPNG